MSSTNRLHGFNLSNFRQTIGFHYGRGKGHMLRYLVNRFRWHAYPRKHIVAKYPPHVDFELCGACNMRCPMCYTVTDAFKTVLKDMMIRAPKGLMDFNLYKRLVDECAEGEVYSIRLSWRGEPTMHPHFMDAVRYAKERGIPEVSSLTNALKLTPDMFEELVDLQMDWLTISFDGMGETYNQIRKPAKFDEAVEKIQKFHEIKKQKRSRKPVVRIQTVWPAIKDNPQAFYDLFTPMVDHVCYIPLLDYLHKDEEIEYIEDFSCPVVFQRLAIAANGIAYQCINDELGQHPVGDTNTQSIYEIWHGKGMEEIRQIHLSHEGYKQRAACKKCYYPRKTETYEEKIGDRTVKMEQLSRRSQQIGT